MSKITLSDEAKNRIKAAAASRIEEKQRNADTHTPTVSRNAKIRSFRSVIGIAACFAVVSAVLLTVHFNSSTDPVTPPDVVNDPPVLAVNPFEEMTSLEEAGEKVGYEVMSPSYLPDGYETDCISLIFGELVEVTYKNSDGGEITYRTQKTESDVSGEYNSYESTESAELEFDGGKVTAELKSDGGKYRLCTWKSGESSFSLSSSDGLGKDELSKIVGGIK